MKGIKTAITTDWQLYPDPLLLKNYDGFLGFAPTDEKTPNGHNCVKIVGRDMVFEYFVMKVYASHKYRFEFVGKCLQGSLQVGGGFWGGTELWNLTTYAQRFVLIKELGNGWGVYRKEVYPREDCGAQLYFQLEQDFKDNGNNTHWLIGDIRVCDLTATGGVIVSMLLIMLATTLRKEVAA